MSWSMEKHTDLEMEKTSGFQEDLEHLRQASMLRGIEYDCLKLLAMLSRRVKLIVDDQVMVQGEDDGYAFLVLSGQIKAVHQRDDTDRIITRIGPGRFVGGCALLGRLPRLLTLVASEETVILRLSRDEFKKTVQQFPSAITQMNRNLLSELVDWDRNLLEAIEAGEEPNFLQAVGVSLL